MHLGLEGNVWRYLRAYLLQQVKSDVAPTVTEEPQWPPRSPYEAILSSPNGRRKLEQRQTRLSPSPSPLKRATTTTRMRSQPHVQDGEDDDEDEETLQLQLQALEAKIKLKKLQNKKAKTASYDVETGDFRAQSPKKSATTMSGSTKDINGTTELLRSKSMGNIQIPLSPERKPVAIYEQKSPGRVLLGIDKGLSARNVSLRRAPGSLAAPSSKDDPFGAPIRPLLSRAESGTASRAANATPLMSSREGLKSFNERIAEARLHTQAEKERQERVAKLRAQKSKGFGVREDQLEAFRVASEKDAASAKRGDAGVAERSYSRADIVDAANRPPGGLVRRANSVNDRGARPDHGTVGNDLHGSEPSLSSRTSAFRKKPSRRGSISLSDDSRPATPGDSTLFEGFSHTNLSRRILPHSFLARTLEDKTPTTIPSLLREVVAPDFSLPAPLEDNDFVVFGIIASKSAPMNHKDPHKSQTTKKLAQTSSEEAAASEANVNGKYMAFTLTDLKWTLDLYIFTTAYVRFRKLQPGTLIAVLNPSIMPPPPGRQDTNRWSLTLHSSDDTILEIGTSKDLAWCKARKKDGNPCNAWVDSRKTDFCEFHIDRSVERARRGRMEVQGMSAPFAPGGKGAGRRGFFGSERRQKDGSQLRDDGLLKEGRQYDRASHSTYYMAPQMASRSAANLLDAEEDGGAHGNREERMRQTLVAQAKEKEIARRLGQGGNGTGAEYLRLRQDDQRKTGTQQFPQDAAAARQRDAGNLGLKDNKAGNVMLSPLKKRSGSIRKAAGASDGAEEGGPQRKKTRFVTAKGIREAGRESIGGDAFGQGDVDLEVV